MASDPPRHLWLLEEPKSHRPELPLRSLGMALRCRGLLVSRLAHEELTEALRRLLETDAPLGTLWEILLSDQDRYVIKETTPFSYWRTSEKPFSMEYCGITRMSDNAIMQEGGIFY